MLAQGGLGEPSAKEKPRLAMAGARYRLMLRLAIFGFELIG
jgi:hypothetical protein